MSERWCAALTLHNTFQTFHFKLPNFNLRRRRLTFTTDDKWGVSTVIRDRIWVRRIHGICLHRHLLGKKEKNEYFLACEMKKKRRNIARHNTVSGRISPLYRPTATPPTPPWTPTQQDQNFAKRLVFAVFAKRLVFCSFCWEWQLPYFFLAVTIWQKHTKKTTVTI